VNQPLTREPVRRAKNREWQQIHVGRGEIELAREFAESNRFTIRSVVEAAIVEYLECRGVPIPAPVVEPEPEVQPPEPAPRPILQSVEVTRDDGETWTMMGVTDRWDERGTVMVKGSDGVTYWRNGGNVRSPFRWRWPRVVQDQPAAGVFYGNRHTAAMGDEASDLAPPNELEARRIKMRLSLRQHAAQVGIHFYVMRGLEQRLTSPVRIDYVCRVPSCNERAYPANAFACETHRGEFSSPPKMSWTKAALRCAAFHECPPEELFPLAGV
jgi:hypothetical protein